ELSLHDFIHIIRKRYLVFLLTVSLVTIGGVLITLNLQPIYQSKATIMIERPPITSEWQLYTEEKDFKMVMQLMNSQSLLQEAMEQAGIASSAMRDMRLNAKMIPDSQMIDITIEDVLPRRLVTVFRHFLPIVTDRIAKTESQNLVRKVDFIKMQLKVVEERLAATDKILQGYAEREMDVSVSDKMGKINADIAKIQDERRMSEVDLSVIGDVLTDLQKKALSVTRGTRSWDTTLQELVELKTTMLQLQRERIKLTSLYQPSHPDVKSLDDQIDFVSRQIEEKSTSVATSSLILDSSGQTGPYVFQKLLDLEAQQKTLVLKIAQMDTLLAEKTAVFKSLLARLEEFNSLSRRQKVDEQIHLSLIEKLNQAEVDRGT
ncbi:MAG TPA: Wzz/FepE/Etk N-terminal domain-containing protein, partial [Candidatus Ozemobacteraceae bacterium]|nr:Wzz/FepE/Etk N-terminal domain-containing protein [Candidatus Ozemobacteraceae bacterium]